jgi:peptidoglycan-associated lipoprotein
MKRSLYWLILLFFVLSTVMSGAVGCKKKGASKGPGEGPKVTGTQGTTTEPGGSRTSDDIPGASERTFTDDEAMNRLADIPFDYDQYTLTTEARDILANHAVYLKKNKSVTVQIEGHCDERGTVEYNMALGQKRADATKEYLVLMGLEASRFTTISYGEERPIDPGHDENAWSKNRRAHFVITSR